MRKFLALVVALTAVPVVRGADKPLVHPFESRASLSRQGKIDGLVFGALRPLRIQPANVCSDGVFVRRVYLDVIGTLPTAEEARRFIMDRSSHKRGALVNQLLERDEFADYWTLKWGDLLRVKAEFPINLWPNAVQAYHRWIRASIRDNMPYDQFVREIITASGSNFRVPQVNFYRSLQSKEPRAMAQAVALTFMGARAEKWQEDRLTKMEPFFSQTGYKPTAEWKEEIVFFDSKKAAAEGPKTAVFPDGTSVELSPDQDPREVFADWLITAENPWFAKNIVNRIWYWLLGSAIITEPDDIRPTNPPVNPKLLSLLEKELVSSRYDMKEIFRQILNSKTYQLSSIPGDDDPEAVKHFAHYRLRRLEAEVLIDALCQITGTTEEYQSAIPEPFTFIPKHQRSIALADGSITSTFLEMFGRPPRDTGMEGERNNRSSAAQRLHLLNSGHVLRKIEQSAKLKKLITTGNDPREKAMMIYLTILSRLPTEKELKIMGDYTSLSEVQGPQALTDVVWALINTTEFYYRH